METITERKQLAAILAGGSGNYQAYKRVMENSADLYKHDLSLYTDDVTQRHDRNLAQWRKLVKLIKEARITPDMLLHNTWNSFYPSYVLHHHYNIFAGIIMNFKRQPELQSFIQGILSHQIFGAYFSTARNWNYLTQDRAFIPSINNKGEIEMNQEIFFYSRQTSLMITHCCFLVKKGSETALAIVELRSTEGELKNNIKIRDFGGTISLDYLNVGYNFNHAQPVFILTLNEPFKKSLPIYKFKADFTQFDLTLNDLKKSICLTIRYGSMRRQFPTLQGTKQQRRIVQYQAVSSRIIDAFTCLCGFSFLNLRLRNIPILGQYFMPLIDYSYHYILEQIIALRQCCGGFGFLQYSGHPGCIERVAYRASLKNLQYDIPDNKHFLKRAHYYSSDDSLQSFFGEKIDEAQLQNFSNFFKIFILICVQMRKKKQQLSKQTYIREFVRQASIQAIYNYDSYGRSQKRDLISKVTEYLIVNYIMENGKYINWTFVKIDPPKLFENLNNYKRMLLLDLAKDMETIDAVLEVDWIRNAVVGRDNSDEFYEEVLTAARTNKRNSKEFVDYVKRPIVEMLTKNNAKL